MGIKLSIEISSPLGADDRDLLTGVSIMTLAIANHELAKEHFPDTFPSPDEITEEQRQDAIEAMPCMVERQGRHCIEEIGHAGRHTYRFILPPTEGLN